MGENLYELLFSFVHYAMKILNNREQAEDLVQGAIIKLWESPLCFENIAVLMFIYTVR